MNLTRSLQSQVRSARGRLGLLMASDAAIRSQSACNNCLHLQIITGYRLEGQLRSSGLQVRLLHVCVFNPGPARLFGPA
jgi:hypothetical protein